MKENKFSTLPMSTPELLKQLDKEHPARCPDPSWSDREIWIYTGKRALIDSLLHKLRRTEENLTAQRVEIKT
jgi:hypothetical protein